MLRPKPQTTPSQELLGLPGPQQRLRIEGPQQPLMLNAPQQALPAPAPVEPTINNFNNFGKMPTGLQSPIPQMPRTLGEVLPKKSVVETNPVDYKALEDNFVQEQLRPHYEYQKQAAEAQTKWQTTVTAAKGEIDRIKQSFGKIYVPKEAMEDYQVPKQFLASGKDKVSDDIFSFADQMGFSSPDEAVQYLKALDEESKTRLKDLMPNGQNMIPEKDLRYREEALRKEFRAKNPQPAPPKQEQTALDIPQIAPEDRKVSRLATFDEMYQRMQETAPPKQESKPLNPLEFKREKGYDLLPKIKNRNGDKPAATEKKSSLLLPLKPVHLKTVKTTKSVHTMNKKELQGVYQELKTKKETFTKTNNQKKMKQVDEDMKQVEGLLMKLDLQLFGKSEPKPVSPKLKTGSESVQTAQPKAEKIAPAKAPVKDPKKEYAIAQSKQKKLVEKYKANGNKQKEELAQLVKNSDQWKDKASPLLKRETMTRNFEDIMGKDAEKVKKAIIDPIGEQEAKSVKWKNQIRDEVKSYKIKGNSKESSLVQKYGEGKVSLEELKQETANWKDVVKASQHLRQFYNEVLPHANKILTENGYPEIPFRKDYFPHAEDLTSMQKFLKKHVGIDFEDHTLPTDINGLTGNFKPGKQFFGNALQRKGDQTNYDAIANFDKYIEGISNVIYHTPNIKRLRAFEQVLREKHTDTKQLSNFVSELEQYTNMLAGKKVGFDHMTEKYTTRKVYTFVDNIRKRTASNMLAYNVSSAITNTIPAFTQAPALVGKKYYLKGMMDTLANVVKKDGFETDFLVRRNGSDPLYRDFWDKATEKGFWLMKVIDKFSSQTIVRSKYYELLDKGIADKEAKRQADAFASKIMADRSKGQIPTLFADKTLGMLTQFQLEVNNQVSFLFKDIPRMSKDKAAMASSYAQVFLYSYLYNNMYEKITGRRPAFDPVGVVKKAIGDYNNDNISKGEATWNTVENVGNQLPFVSIATGGRYPIEAGIPNVKDLAQGKTTLSKEAAKPLTYLVPPTGGGQAKKVYQAATDFGLNPLSKRPIPGSYRTDAKGNKHLQYPIDNSPSKAAQEALFGRSSLSETNDFFNNRRKELSPKQTRLIEESSNPQADFQALTVQRRMKSIQNEIKSVGKDTSLTPAEKDKKRLKLVQELTKLREGK
jgi:hypothetical protein